MLAWVVSTWLVLSEQGSGSFISLSEGTGKLMESLKHLLVNLDGPICGFFIFLIPPSGLAGSMVVTTWSGRLNAKTAIKKKTCP